MCVGGFVRPRFACSTYHVDNTIRMWTDGSQPNSILRITELNKIIEIAIVWALSG